MSQSLQEPLGERSVLLCCGSGGVGKTTTAAALGVAAASLGRRCCVVTIDPARRLADALGIAEVDNSPKQIIGPFSGELSAVMLDASATFDNLINRYATDADQASRILSNRVYQNLANSLSGTQEYMATEKLFELYESGDFDLIIVDTPPTRSALDFLDAPRRMSGFLDNRIFRLLLAPGRGYLRAMSVASQMLLRTVARIAGSEIVEDAIAFFQAFEGMEAGFKDRADRVEKLLETELTAFILVAAPRRDTVQEATYFADRLAERHGGIDALIVNRVHPDFAGPAIDDEGPEGSAWSELLTNLVELSALAHLEELALATDLLERVEPAPVVRVPFLDREVNDLDGLQIVARHLLGRELP